MWSFNVTRRIVRQAGLRVTPDPVPKFDGAMFDAAAQYLESPEPDCYCVIKVHEAVKPDPRIRIIRNRRHPADRLFSFIRFTGTPFSEAFVREFAETTRRVERYYDQWPEERILNVSYDDLENDSRRLVAAIADFIGLAGLGDAVISRVDESLSRSSVRELVVGLDDADAGQRSFDETTGFQAGHVSNYRPGDWRKLWSDVEIAVVERILLREEPN